MLRLIFLSVCLFFGIISNAFAAYKKVDLFVDYKRVDFTGTPAKGIAVNGQIPGPTLHFKEGDTVEINVHNNLNVGTAIHWHGIILPWQMDGVAHVTQEPIPPGGTFKYKYKLKQSGTYWYHAHADLQEQQGLYGAYIIDPVRRVPFKYSKDFPIVLSDWINEDPDKVYHNLKRDGDYYSTKLPLQPSLMKYLKDYSKADAAGKKRLNMAYSMMQQMRMSPYDFSDIAYDAFLLNGKTSKQPWSARVKVGDVVRLRFIDAGATTQFRIKIPGSKMKVVEVQGNIVKPHWVDSLYMAPGETMDVLVKIKKDQPYIIYVESNDKLGSVYGVLKTHKNQQVKIDSVVPFPEPQPILMMHHDMAGMQHEVMSHHAGMKMKDMPEGHMQHHMSQGETKYQYLRSPIRTNNPNKPYQTINMTLSGWMDRYVWFLNGKPEYDAKPILIEPGKRYRFVFRNETMMQHPMHLHGHWLILRNRYDAYDPLLHTILVKPGETVVADFDADAKEGFWYFHCHNLFHMKAGMTNVVIYGNTPLPGFMQHGQYDYIHRNDVDYLNRKITAHPAKWFGSRLLEVEYTPRTNDYSITGEMLFGSDLNRIKAVVNNFDLVHGVVTDADADLVYWRLIDQFWAVKAGVNYYYRPAQKPYWQPVVGIEGLAPFFIDMDLRAYYRAGSVKFDWDFMRDFQITNNFFIGLGAEIYFATHDVIKDDITSGLNEIELKFKPYYRLNPKWSIFMEYERTNFYGKRLDLRRLTGEHSNENSLSVGFDWAF